MTKKNRMLPTITLAGRQVTRLIVGGNPFSGNSHASAEMDWQMARYFSQERILETLARCEQVGINTLQARADAFIMRTYLEHRERGGTLHWIAQTASEFASLPGNVAAIARFGAIAAYLHGSQTDRLWQAGKLGEIRDSLKVIRDAGLPVGLGSHIPEVIEHAHAEGWGVDFYMCCFYNLSREGKELPTVGQPGSGNRFEEGDPDRMTAVMRAVPQPCLGFKILAAGRRCGTPADVRAAFEYAFARIKPTDAVVVGVFPRDRDQVGEDAAIVEGLQR